MEIRETTETRRIIEIEDQEIDMGALVRALGAVRYGGSSTDYSGAGLPALRKLKRLGYVKRVPVRSDYDMSVEGHKWKQVDGKCDELFRELNEPYSKWRVRSISTTLGVFDGSSYDGDAEGAAEDRLRELDERNPDVEFRITEEQIDHIPTGDS